MKLTKILIGLVVVAGTLPTQVRAEQVVETAFALSTSPGTRGDVYFFASPGGSKNTPMAADSPPFAVTSIEDLRNGFIAETRESRHALDVLLQRLQVKGWIVIARSSQWWRLRLSHA